MGDTERIKNTTLEHQEVLKEYRYSVLKNSNTFYSEAGKFSSKIA